MGIPVWFKCKIKERKELIQKDIPTFRKKTKEEYRRDIEEVRSIINAFFDELEENDGSDDCLDHEENSNEPLN